MRSHHKPTERPFRFGVLIATTVSRKELVANYRRAEAVGCDVIGVTDHLDSGAPFPALALAGEVTERPRLATAVLNASFYNPALLAREVCAVDRMTDGRVELGLGAGHMKAEFDAAGIVWPRPRERVAHLHRAVAAVQDAYADRACGAGRGCPPLWLAGRGDKVLGLAAEHADIVGFSGTAPGKDGDFRNLCDIQDLEERVRHVEDRLGPRVDHVERNIYVSSVVITNNRRRAAERLAPYRGLEADQILRVPMFMIGTVAQIVEQLEEFRARLGFSYLTIGDPDIDALAQVIEAVR